MTTQFYSYQPQQGHGLPHDPIPSLIGPRPIGWISTCDKQGNTNLAPYSFFNIFNYSPPILVFSSVGKKDSVTNAIETGEFVYNLATLELGQQVNSSSAMLPRGESEFDLTGLSTLPSTLITPPRIAQTPVSMECVVTEYQQLKRADGSLLDTWMIMGEVVMVHIDEATLEQGLYNSARQKPLMRAGGPADYYWIEEQQKLEMYRPK
ncbi:flavin reductase family protein [Providencia sp. PROV188]|jgi:flavin reductase (DIM6/NTAB) family NADH-FMN oxidoreductase RutF|uniref:Flavin reductase (DIM6/NTAB) family NADH-FMN oxidoreductase RutF n=2 Tax=Providencia TaxID=586 RepID=A0A4R3NEQ6_9GAMM|nr:MULTISPECIES: flavin reductase family protein [Providencia]ETS98970.1 flavin reductase-like protein [Providencia alcalifaciens PAL-3]EUC99283.1 flavin reductase-like protein [Providencia alcalifaciens PAL-1]MBG5884292.1 flavin reductase family protein [Providencia alcalifaciens]MDR2241689.1 flavin reductase family protein [Providencia alcalifaciens]MTC22514.1 flavin reductase family protein [Providencia sp. wls1938]